MQDNGTIETLPLKGKHTTLGLIVKQHEEYENTVVLHSCQPGTIAHKTLHSWRRRLRGAIIAKVNDTTIHTTKDFATAIDRARKSCSPTIRVEFSCTQWHLPNGEGIPVPQHNEMMNIAHHLHNMRHGDSIWDQTNSQLPPPTSHKAKAKGPQLTRRKVQKLPNWEKFRASEWVQLNKYRKQDMFGTPQPRSSNDVMVLPWVWSYLYKTNPVTLEKEGKARGTCNGGQR